MILLIDNYDSFSFNLWQLIGTLAAKKAGGADGANASGAGGRESSAPAIKVVRNDGISLSEIVVMRPSHIFISPGPGKPGEAGACEQIIETFAGKIPIFGVCLGHQAICEAFGATVSYAKGLMHGKASAIKLDTSCPVFAGMSETIQGGRYHSLAAEPDTIPETLLVTATSSDGEVMAVRHKDYDVYGVQFHPESILTPEGGKIVENFLKL